MHQAKIFMNGKSQAIRLPKNFRFSTKEVSITPLGKGVVLQPLLKTWKDIFKQLAQIPTDFYNEKREDCIPQERESFK